MVGGESGAACAAALGITDSYTLLRNATLAAQEEYDGQQKEREAEEQAKQAQQREEEQAKKLEQEQKEAIKREQEEQEAIKRQEEEEAKKREQEEARKKQEQERQQEEQQETHEELQNPDREFEDGLQDTSFSMMEDLANMPESPPSVDASPNKLPSLEDVLMNELEEESDDD
mmetsp:Transcript_3317/g.7343  ORF Transcript_3317/g.7343 Transcript_3317/m.7343 type:complete len:173 (+) Transcript_3317:679-1197(+)